MVVRSRSLVAFTVAWFVACSGSVEKPGPSTGTQNPGSSPTDHSGHGGDLPPGTGVPISSMPSSGSGMRWSDPATWGGKVPDERSDVTIKNGTSITLDKNACVATLVIEGELTFADADLELCARWIFVHHGGKLHIGSEAKPFEHKAIITLVGSNPTEDVVGFGTKFLGAMDDGTLDLHGGGPRTAWTKLARAAAAGDAQITVDDASGWSVGDQIVIASDTTEPNEAEVHVLTAVDGKTLKLDKPLAHARAGTVRTVEGRMLDERAEVGVLTRRIVIRGDESSDGNRFGGHVMLMPAGKAYVEGVELVRMGQYDRLGRYPFHWHIALDSKGQYLKRSVVNGGYQRGIVVHSTQSVTVADNISFDTTGHNFIVETPVTTGNVFDHNLALKNKLGLFTNADITPQGDAEVANFWIKSANNTFTNNAAAGSEANGFWFDGVANEQGTFKNNVIHSAAGRGTRADFVRESGLLAQITGDPPQGSALTTFSDSLLYANAIGIWPNDGTQLYENFVIDGAGNPGTVSEGSFTTFKNTLFVGKNGNGNALGIQYSGRVVADGCTFVDGGIMFANDIFADPQADVSITGAKFVGMNPKSFAPLEYGLFEALDDSYLPKGFYVSADPIDAPQVLPGAQKVMLGGDANAGDGASPWLRVPRRYTIALLMTGKGSHTPSWDEKQFLLRSDGYRYNDMGRSRLGYRVIVNEDLRYQLETAPVDKDLFLSLMTFGYVVGGGAGKIELAVPRATDPGQVVWLDGDVTRDPKRVPLARAASLDEFRADTDKRWYYDAAKKLVYLQVDDQKWRVIP
jgi:hypothetical protein